MLESVIELLFGLLFSALLGSCVVGSICAALRAVNREGDGHREKVKRISLLGLK
jgi:hypothetical protein